jgi:hypothetical protein
MKFLAAYIMRGRMQAGLVAAVMAVLSLLVPPVSYLSGAAVGLFTLRNGPSQGLQVSLLAAVAAALLATLVVGSPMFGLAFVLVLWLPVWALAASLRRSVSLSHCVWLATLFGVALILGMYASVGDPVSWWTELLQEYMQEALQGQDGEQVEQLLALVPDVARLMTGVLAAALCLSLLGSLFIARWWQAVLYNPGGFGKEFQELRLGKPLSIATVVLALLSSVMDSGSAMAADLIVLALVVLMLQGLAVIHGLVAKTKAHVGWLIGVYVLLVIAMLQTVLTLALAGFADAWFDFRRFFNRDGSSNNSDKEAD